MNERQRKIVVFYTYKGGIGRSMALVNTAWRLATRHGLRVLVVDWDLEAPSLDQYFGIKPERVDPAASDGVLEYLLQWGAGWISEDLTTPSKFQKRFLQVVDQPQSGQILLMKAGRSIDRQYSEDLQKLRLMETADKGAIDALRDVISSSCDIALVDSRTGLTDIGYICTKILPDALFMLTAANEQSWAGLLSAANNVRPPKDENDTRSFEVLGREGRDTSRAVWLGVSRVPLVGELYLTDRWLSDNQEIFDSGIGRGFWDAADHPEGLRSFLIPHNGRWTVGQRILKTPEAGPDDYLSLAFDRIAEALSLWHRKPTVLHYRHQEPRYSIPLIQADMEAAMQRRDYAACAQLCYLLGSAFYAAGDLTESRRAFESAALVALGRQDGPLFALSMNCVDELDGADQSRLSAGAWDTAALRAAIEKALNNEDADLRGKKMCLLVRTGLPGPDELERIS